MFHFLASKPFEMGCIRSKPWSFVIPTMEMMRRLRQVAFDKPGDARALRETAGGEIWYDAESGLPVACAESDHNLPDTAAAWQSFDLELCSTELRAALLDYMLPGADEDDAASEPHPGDSVVTVCVECGKSVSCQCKGDGATTGTNPAIRTARPSGEIVQGAPCHSSGQAAGSLQGSKESGSSMNNTSGDVAKCRSHNTGSSSSCFVRPAGTSNLRDAPMGEDFGVRDPSATRAGVDPDAVEGVYGVSRERSMDPIKPTSALKSSARQPLITNSKQAVETIEGYFRHVKLMADAPPMVMKDSHSVMKAADLRKLLDDEKMASERRERGLLKLCEEKKLYYDGVFKEFHMRPSHYRALIADTKEYPLIDVKERDVIEEMLSKRY